MRFRNLTRRPASGTCVPASQRATVVWATPRSPPRRSCLTRLKRRHARNASPRRPSSGSSTKSDQSCTTPPSRPISPGRARKLLLPARPTHPIANSCFARRPRRQDRHAPRTLRSSSDGGNRRLRPPVVGRSGDRRRSGRRSRRPVARSPSRDPAEEGFDPSRTTGESLRPRPRVDRPRPRFDGAMGRVARRRASGPPGVLGPSPTFSDSALCLDAAVAGQGVMMAWPTLAQDALRDGAWWSRSRSVFGRGRAAGSSPPRAPRPSPARGRSAWLRQELTADAAAS